MKTRKQGQGLRTGDQGLGTKDLPKVACETPTWDNLIPSCAHLGPTWANLALLDTIFNGFWRPFLHRKSNKNMIQFDHSKSLTCVRRHHGSIIFKFRDFRKSFKIHKEIQPNIDAMLKPLQMSHKIPQTSNLGTIWAQLRAILAQLGPKLDPQNLPS